MDHQAKLKFIDQDILDLSSENYNDIDFDSTSWLISSTRNSQKVKNTKTLKVPVSAEELKIRSELEMEIEKDLEEEIKESIYHLALRLHRIYKQRKERSNAKEASEYGNKLDKRSRALSEVNISIRMERGAKVEIKEVNKQVTERGYRPENAKELKGFGGNKNKFDWVKTLRQASSPADALNTSNGSSKHKPLQSVWKV